MSDVSIGIFGATGEVGRQALEALARRDVELEAVRAFASAKNAGETLELTEGSLDVEAIGDDSFRGLDTCVLAVPPEVAKPLAERAQAQGVWVVDCSGAFRLDEKVPLVIPGVNDGVVDRPFPGRVVSLASASAQAVAAVLEPLKKKLGLVLADVTLLVGAAWKGREGIERLSLQTAQLMNGKEPDVELFPHRLAFNLIPGVGDFEQGLSALERQVMVELARAWAGEGLPALTATGVLVPTYHGTMAILSAHCQRPADADGVRAILKEESGLKLVDDPAQHVYPMPMLTNDDPSVLVGRVRAHAGRVQLVACVDNACRMGDAAVELALELPSKDEMRH
jgi:aspartate-semialdehyde dehydrogenase